VFQFAWGGPAATGKRLLTGSPGRPRRWRSARCQLSRTLHQAQLSRRGDVTPIPTAYAGSGLSPDPASPVRRSLARCTRLHRRKRVRHREVGTRLEAGKPLTLVRRELRRLVRREFGGISSVGISCVVTVTGVSDLLSGRTAALSTKAESVGGISAAGMGASLNFPGKRMWGLSRLLTHAPK